MSSKSIRCLLVYFLCIQTLYVVAQDQRIADDLSIVYNEGALQGEEKLELLRNLSFNEINNLELSLKYAEELIRLSEIDKNDSYLFKGYYQKGNTHRLLGDLDEALKAFVKSSEVAIKSKENNREGTSYMAIADVYSVMGNSENAQIYYDKAILLLRNGDDSVLLATALLNAGDEYLNDKNYTSALSFFEESGQIFKKEGHMIGSAYNLGNIGMVYAELGKDELAKSNINDAVSILEELKDYYAISDYLTYMSDIYLRQKNWNRALSYAQRSYDLSVKYGLKNQISESSLKLSDLYNYAENYKSAYTFYKTHIEFRDEVQNLENIQKMADIRTDFEVSQKQTQVDLLNQQKKNQRITLYATILATLLTGILAFGLFKRYRFIRRTNVIIEKERERSDNLLLNILPEDTALELKNKGRVEAKRFESVTVLFTDFKGFSTNAEQLSPEALVESVDFYFTKFDSIIESYGLEKIKTVGDSYMCAAGLPFPIENHAKKMVMAAIDIADFVNTVKLQHPDSNIHYDVRIGINTGPVVAGVVGSKKFAYDIWGDTVNIASRMESSSEPGKINISQFTYEHVKDAFSCEYRGEIEVKNRGLLKMYFVNQKI